MLHWDESQLLLGNGASQGRPEKGEGQIEGLGPWGAGPGFSSPPPHTSIPDPRSRAPW